MQNQLYTVSTYYQAITLASNLIASKSKDQGKLNIVFTPEKNTMLLESAITSLCGGYINTRVLSFGKYLKYNRPLENLLSREASVMVIRRILDEVKDDLSCFRTYSTKIAENLYDSIALLKSAKVGVSDLTQATASVDGLLKAKLSDLTLVYGKYEDFLSKGYYDETAMLTVIPSVMCEDESLKNTDVYLVGFDSWTRQARNVVSLLLDLAKSVTVVAVGGGNDGVYTNEIPSAFCSLCADKNQSVKMAEHIVETGLGQTLLNSLYSESAFKIKSIKSDAVSILKFADLTEEIRYVAKTIRKEVLNGARYRDFTVALPSNEDYSDIVKKVFADYGVPYYLDEKKSFAQHVLARFVIGYLEVIRKNFEQSAVFEFIKNPLFNFERSTCDKFENFALKKNIKFSGFKKPFIGAPSGVEELRQKLVSLDFDINGIVKVDRFIDSIENLLMATDAEKTLQNITKTLSLADPSEAEYSKKAFSVLEDILSFIKAFLSGVKMPIKEFVMLLKSGFTASEISIIPQLADAVYIGGYKDCGNLKAKVLFAPGLNGSVPEVKQDIAVLSDGDITKLGELKVIIEPKVRAVNARAREIFATSLSAFDKKLYLSYCVQGRNGKELKRSDALPYLEKIFGKKATLVNPQNFEDNVADRYLSKGQSEKQFATEVGLFREGILRNFDGASACYYAFDDVFGENSPCKKILADDFIAMAERKIITKKPVVKEFVSASMLENYYSCPFKCFMDYGLRLKEREIGEIRPKDSGNFIHKIVELYAEEFKKGTIITEDDSDAVTKKFLEDLLLEEDYLRYREDLSNSNALDRLVAECYRVTRSLFYQLKNTDFKVVGAEVSFGYPDSNYKPIVLKTKTGELKIRGKVDRVDAYKNYFRVVDYKTGSEEMSDSELYMGKKLQLFLYLNAFAKGDDLPSGTYYYKIADGYLSDEKETPSQFDGKTVGIEEILNASDNTVAPDQKSKITGLSIKGLSRKTNAVTSQEGMVTRMHYAKLLAEKGANFLQNGEFPASPISHDNFIACDYCEYGAICRFEKGLNPTRELKSVSAKDLDTVLDGEDINE